MRTTNAGRSELGLPMPYTEPGAHAGAAGIWLPVWMYVMAGRG